MPNYVDIAFPTAVRQLFTYQLPAEFLQQAQPGKRVWVPLRKHKAIGFIIRIHSNKPDFNTRKVKRILDDESVLSEELLKLTGWMHRFYYCSWGEAIQAALPAGLNFYAEKRLRIVDGKQPKNLDQSLQEVVNTIRGKDSYAYKEANKRWGRNAVETLIGRKLVELYEAPNLKMKPNMEKVWRWAHEDARSQAGKLIKEYRKADKMYKWVQAVEVLMRQKLPSYQKDLRQHSRIEYYTLNRMAEEGLIQAEEVEANNLDLRYEYDPEQLNTLNREQQAAFREINESQQEREYQSFLLHGVTGSGKTEVYIHALKKTLEQGEGGLVLVPEIGLTPQIVRRFYKIFGDDIAVLHSRLTNRERYDAWRALQQGEKRIAIGARSAVFAPVQNLGLIVVDEEHDASYKQKNPAPRYHGRDVAIMRAHINDAVTILGSATPSMSSLYGAHTGKSTLLTLKERPFGATLPKVEVLDLKEYQSAMRGPLTVPVYQAMEEAIQRNEQVILLYNRRGYSSYLQCQHCGNIPECPNCSVSMTYHKSKGQLRCHYCGYSERRPEECPECEHDMIEPQGSGTQQLEERISELFPKANTLRMDYDTTSSKTAHADILSAFGQKEADILIGTQIVGKGLDFPDVTVVGVIDADTELAFPSFRSGERMYQLLSQVAGRSGRSGKEGHVFFQTWQPDHAAIVTSREHRYNDFARQELEQRKALRYPPFSRIIRFDFKGKQEGRVRRVALAFTESLEQVLGSFKAILGPSPAPIARMQKYYLWESIVKIKPTNGASAIEQLLDRTFAHYEEYKSFKGSGSVRINVNVDALE